jgi:hypothetical protein
LAPAARFGARPEAEDRTMDRIDIRTARLSGHDRMVPPTPAAIPQPRRRPAARTDAAAERILRGYARCWGRLDSVVYQVSLAGLKECFPDLTDGDAKECVARAALGVIARDPTLFWRDPGRAARARR